MKSLNRVILSGVKRSRNFATMRSRHLRCRTACSTSLRFAQDDTLSQNRRRRDLDQADETDLAAVDSSQWTDGYRSSLGTRERNAECKMQNAELGIRDKGKGDPQ